VTAVVVVPLPWTLCHRFGDLEVLRTRVTLCAVGEPQLPHGRAPFEVEPRPASSPYPAARANSAIASTAWSSSASVL
jgi:hypothetical protein